MKRNDTAKKIKQATKDYSNKSTNSDEENLIQILTSDSARQPSSPYAETTDSTTSQDITSKILDSSQHENSTRTEERQLENNDCTLKNKNENVFSHHIYKAKLYQHLDSISYYNAWTPK